MSRQDDPQTHPNFDAPIEIVADPSLSKQEKAETLEDLEQDARQLAIASGEGMSGGEPTALAEVLHAKEALELPSTDFAYELVLKDVEARRLTGDGDARLIAQAAAALAALQKPTGLAADRSQPAMIRGLSRLRTPRNRYGRPNFSWSVRCCRTFHRLSGECRIEGVPRLIDESLPGALGCRAGRSAWAQI